MEPEESMNGSPPADVCASQLNILPQLGINFFPQVGQSDISELKSDELSNRCARVNVKFIQNGNTAFIH
jgi:hypothetical protein